MNILLLTVAVAVCQISFAVAYPAESKVLETLENGQADIRTKEGFEYMRRFGYLNRRPQAMTWADYEQGMKRVQKMMGVPQTGIADDATYEMMKKPRCGNPDGHVYSLDDERDWEDEREWEEGLNAGDVEKNTHSKRYVLFGGKPSMRDFKYKVTGYKTGMTALQKARFDKALHNSYQYWARETSLTFTPTTCSDVDLKIYFGGKTHGDCNAPFGTYTLAHAFRPSASMSGLYGDMHFNDQKTWAVRPANTAEGYSMEVVATHEIGHALGLDHSDVADSIMTAYYPHAQNPSSYTTLRHDDLDGIHAIYGDQNTPYGTAAPIDPACVDTAKQYY